jgi:hypothetical protein
MTTVQQVIEAGYLRSSRNAPGKTAVDAELIGFINRIYATYYLLMAKASPDRFRSELSVVLVGAPPSAAIPATVRDIIAAELAGAEVSIIPREEIARSWHLAPCLVWIGSVVRSRALTGDPVAGDTITLLVLLGATALAALADVLDPRFTDEYLELLILEVAVYLGIKDANRDADEHKTLVVERSAAQTTFLRLNGYSTSAVRSPAVQALQTARGEGVTP